MRFKTTIKLITEAEDKNEAMEIAGEYLSGNLTTGVDMKFRTAQVGSNKQRAGIVLVIVMIFGMLVLHISSVRNSQNKMVQNFGDSAIQPILKTAPIVKVDSDFKREWQAQAAQEALDSIKK